MADSPAWKRAKAAGDGGEAAVAALLRAAGFHALRQVEGRAPGFDLAASARIEVKVDNLCAETGNVAIESAYRGKPSGIATTRADLWALVAGGEILIVPVDALRRFAQKRQSHRGGDGGQSVFSLVPLAEIKAAAVLSGRVPR